MRIEILIPNADIAIALMKAKDKPNGVKISYEKLASFSESPNVNMYIEWFKLLPLEILLWWVVNKLMENNTKNVTINKTTINLIEMSSEDVVEKIRREYKKQDPETDKHKNNGEK